LMLVDAHCHLSMGRLARKLPEVIKRAKERNLIAIVTSTISPEDFSVTRKLVEKYKGYVFISLGLHPPGVNPTTLMKTIELIKKHQREIVAIGEVGLDYYWVKDEKRREFQRAAFREFIKLSDETNLPLVIHSREAGHDTFKILEECDAKRVMLHCFSDSTDMAAYAVKKGWLISIPTTVTRRKVHKDAASVTPLDSMLVETDSPFLSPFGGVNEPANVYYAVEAIARIKGVDIETVANKTSENALKFFEISI